VVDRVAGVEEDEVAQPSLAPGDPYGGVVLLLSGAGQVLADPGVGVLGQARAVEPGPGRSAIPVGDG